MDSLGYERSLICFYTQLNQEVSNISVEDKKATSVVIGALKMKRNNLSLSYRQEAIKGLIKTLCVFDI